MRQGLQARLAIAGGAGRHPARGLSPGPAARLRLAVLPATAPSPRLLWSYDHHGWVALAFEDIGGKLPTLPWQPDELQRVLDAVAELATTLTPAPVAAPSIATRLGEAFSGWHQLAAAAELGGGDLAGLDPWARRHLDRLVALEQTWPAAAAAVRCCTGRPPTRAAVRAASGGARVDPDAVTAVLAGLTGYLVWECRQPPPPGLPTLRAFQHSYSRPALAWLRQRTGWP